MTKYCNHPDCSDGKIFDRSTRGIVQCPLCLDILQRNVSEGVVEGDTGKTVSFSETLGLKRLFTNIGLSLDRNFERVLGSSVRDYDEGVLSGLRDALERVVTTLSTGRALKSSLLVYLGSGSDIELFSYLCLGSAKKAGLAVCPFLTPYRYRSYQSGSEEAELVMLADVLVLTYSPSIREDALMMEDIVRSRGYEGRSTIVVLSDGIGLNSVIQRLCTDSRVSKSSCLYLGIPKVVGDESRHIMKVNRIIRYSNKKLGTSTPELPLEDTSSGGGSKLPIYGSLNDIYG